MPDDFISRVLLQGGAVAAICLIAYILISWVLKHLDIITKDHKEERRTWNETANAWNKSINDLSEKIKAVGEFNKIVADYQRKENEKMLEFNSKQLNVLERILDCIPVNGGTKGKKKK